MHLIYATGGAVCDGEVTGFAKMYLTYGKGSLELKTENLDVTVMEPHFAAGVGDEQRAVLKALEQPIGTPPLREIVRPGESVAVVVPDITRPLPTEKIVGWVLEHLAPVPGLRYTFIVGTGSHRQCTRQELRTLLGEAVLESYNVINHNAFDDSNVPLGYTTSGARVLIDREYVKADRRLLIGLIEPHFFAGFSGGPKAVAPGIAGIETILHLHSSNMIEHPLATWAVLDGNPIYEESLEACSILYPDFCLNVSVNKRRQITGVFAGDLVKAHRAGCEFVKLSSVVIVPHRFDVVLTTNGGWPLDQNLYQTVKGLSAAARIVKDGGSIICASECADGVPRHGNFGRLLGEALSPKTLLESILNSKTPVPDQWQVQILARILMKADVYLYSSLPEEEVEAAFMTPIGDVSATLEQQLGKFGPGAKAAVLPEGPFTVPTLRE